MSRVRPPGDSFASEAAEEAKPCGGDRLAHCRHIFPVVQVVHRISILKAHNATVDDLVGVDEADAHQVGNRTFENLLIGHSPDAIAFICGDLRHDRRCAFRDIAAAEVLRKRDSMKKDRRIGNVYGGVRMAWIVIAAEEHVDQRVVAKFRGGLACFSRCIAPYA